MGKQSVTLATSLYQEQIDSIPANSQRQIVCKTEKAHCFQHSSDSNSLISWNHIHFMADSHNTSAEVSFFWISLSVLTNLVRN